MLLPATYFYFWRRALDAPVNNLPMILKRSKQDFAERTVHEAVQARLHELETEKKGLRKGVGPQTTKDSGNDTTNQQQSQETLVLHTKLGDIRIEFRPNYSPESVDYWREVVAQNACDRCNFYRAEKPGILQGIVKSHKVSLPIKKGDCPPEFAQVPNQCPSHDPSCGCHGPVMTRGAVGWAAGKTGPDFFIDDYLKPAEFWGTQHTVFGQIVDQASFAVIDEIWTLPAHKQQGGLTMLEEPIPFTMSIEPGGGGKKRLEEDKVIATE